MADAYSPKTLRGLARLALQEPKFRSVLLPFLRSRVATSLHPEARLRIELRRLAKATEDPRLVARIAEVLESGEKAARFEEGTSVDVEKWLRDRGLDDAADEWAANTEKYKDKFKA